MIKILKTLCLSLLISHFCSAANLPLKEEFETLKTQVAKSFSDSSSDNDQLKTLQARATAYYLEGQYDYEGLVRLKIFKINPTIENLRLVIQSCVVCKEFTEGMRLLEDHKARVSKSDFISLRNTLQDEAVRVEQEKFNASPKTTNLFERFVYGRKVSKRAPKARSSVKSFLSVLH